MGNCLVTRLKNSIDNEKLPILGKLRIKIDTTGASLEDYYNKFSIRTTQNNTLKVLNGHNLYDMTGNSLGDTIALPARTTVNMRIIETGVYYIEIENKYNILNLQLPETAVIDLSELSYINLAVLSIKQNSVNNLTGDVDSLSNTIANLELILKGATVFGTTSKLSKMSLNESLNLFRVSITGDIADLGTKTNNLTIRNTGIAGSLEDFVRAKVVDAQQTSGTIVFNGLQTNKITYKEALITTSSTLSWQPSTTSGKTIISYAGEQTEISNT